MDFSSPRSVKTNGIRMNYFEQGEGPVVLLLHGFPELPYSWRHVVDPIADAGFRVIVPAQRGYGGTDAPASADSYTVKNLVRDLTGLLDSLNIADAIWVGHDWGGMPAWYSAHYAPDRVRGIASLGLPYVHLGEYDLVEAYDQLLGPRNYMRAFQEPGAPEALLQADIAHVFRSILRGRGYTRDEFEAAPAEVRELPATVFVGDPMLFGDPIVTDDELAYYVRTFGANGFTGPLNWYRALHADYLEAQGIDYTIDKPVLMIKVTDDWFFQRGATDGMGDVLPQLTMRVVDDAAHWVQQEKPAEVASLLVTWLVDNFRD